LNCIFWTERYFPSDTNEYVTVGLKVRTDDGSVFIRQLPWIDACEPNRIKASQHSIPIEWHGHKTMEFLVESILIDIPQKSYGE
jgi:hypothetical protein